MKTYKATINGIDHTFQLDDADAVKRGLDPAKDSVGDAPVEKSPLDTNPALEPDTKARTVANKAAAAADTK